MKSKIAAKNISTDVSPEILCSPVLLYLYYRVEQILGIKSASDALIKLNEYLEEKCGSSFIKNPAAFEVFLGSDENIFEISKFLTVSETYFFRESPHFELLETLLPELAKLGHPLQICCIASSIGCEPYSIAMLLDYHIKNGLKLEYSIDAFDVNIQGLETAKSGLYTSNTIRNDGSKWKFLLDTYLIPKGDEYLITQNIRNKVHFFPFNIMNSLERQYDIIFFRNSFIYFSDNSRILILNNIAESLFKNGLLFLGVSEINSVKHPLLVTRLKHNVYYFQKASTTSDNDLLLRSAHLSPVKRRLPEKKQTKDHVKKQDSSVNCAEIAEILKVEDGKLNAESVMNAIEMEEMQHLSGSQYAACVIHLLSCENFDNANRILSQLEKICSSPCTKFLRGEYFYLSGNTDEAENYFQEAAIKDKHFWPAFYRVAILAEDGNRTRFEYKIKKTIESINLIKNLHQSNGNNYECFMGGFSPDYFKRILEKKLS